MNNIKQASVDAMVGRFIELIKEHPQKWWAKKLDVSQGVISSSWMEGKLPRPETLFKIMTLKRVTANWFFFGIGPRKLEDLEDKNQVFQKKQKIHRKILEQDNEIAELRERIQELELFIKENQVKSLFYEKSNDTGIGFSDAVKMITFIRLFNEIIFKGFEIAVENDLNKNSFIKIIDWVNSNYESSIFKTIASLKDLEKIIPPIK